MHHGQLGGLDCPASATPAWIVTGTIFHHTPAEGHSIICDFTYLANEAAKRIEAEFDGCRIRLEIMPDVAQLTGHRIEPG